MVNYLALDIFVYLHTIMKYIYIRKLSAVITDYLAFMKEQENAQKEKD